MANFEEFPIESNFDKTYDDMLSKLQERGDEKLADFITELSPETKERLAQVLNRHARDWALLASGKNEDSTTVMARITEWESVTKVAPDAQTTGSADTALVAYLESV